ncbi:F-box protein [Candidatus Protochlamydia phocaeensis]|uniref:F-box protein n=1 Tax=Candidatus Protochlamydia phocaeensis TaxID=1414722 RepID=UPI000837F985|nr:F-box protein [Candidatus Protochlamydia phocaeensis]
MQVNPMNSAFAFYGILDDQLRQQQSFCDKAYLNYNVLSEEEIQEALLSPRTGLSPIQAQTTSLFLAIFPLDLQKHLFGFLGLRDLKACLFTCKQFNIIATPFFIKSAFLSLSVDFAAFECRINRHLTNIEPPKGNLNNKKVTIISPFTDKNFLGAEIKELEATTKQISSFKAYCVFLINAKRNLESGQAKEDRATGKDEEQQAIQKLTSLLKLEKACKACSSEKEARLKAMPISLNSADLVVRPLISPSDPDLFFKKS